MTLLYPNLKTDHFMKVFEVKMDRMSYENVRYTLIDAINLNF
jgi:hypothetical protein